MPMMKNFTLSFYFNTYYADQSTTEAIGSKSREGGINNMIEKLSEPRFSPSEQSVQNILNFSKSYEVLESRLTKSIEIIKN
ncbi:hypothetical protein DET65_4140 [Sunxiuqinia elliptica]|uniref:Uncharacterized protein n=2 Tax=Sunxiuqinia elliptica TaxID=655355 RepID=A0A4R6GUX2_9BACT|nr:hypothetical protein DET52_107275 [Sunxiuqinia elliptica]TDO56583.1 hypothetical protein DET65_4140 [Sunxiuqinia elliptica]